MAAFNFRNYGGESSTYPFMIQTTHSNYSVQAPALANGYSSSVLPKCCARNDRRTQDSQGVRALPATEGQVQRTDAVSRMSETAIELQVPVQDSGPASAAASSAGERGGIFVGAGGGGIDPVTTTAACSSPCGDS